MSQQMLFTNNATTTLASGITNSATTLTVATGTGVLFPSPSSQYFYCSLSNIAGTEEIVKVTAVSTDTFTITRAQDNTSASAWNAGDKVELRNCAANWNNTPQLDAANVFTNAQNYAQGADIASASTVNLNTVTGNYVHVTGTTTITAITLSQGYSRTVVFTGALTLTNGASLILPGGANISTAAGDSAVFVGDGSSVVRCVSYITASGAAIIQNNGIQLFPLTASVTSNALTISLASCKLDFRNTTLSGGSNNVAVSTGAISITVPSTATLGTVNSTAARLVALVAYNGGTPVLCVSNIAGAVNLDETTLISPTTISTSATSSSVIYSAASVSASSPFRVVGFLDITESTAGTWATGPTNVQPGGGQALAALSSVGYGQVWTSESRTSGTTYYNTTGKPITALAQYTATGSGTVEITVAGTNAANSGGPSGTFTVQALVPPGASYVYTVSGTISTVAYYELR